MQPPPSNNSSSSGINNKSRGSISTSSRRRALRLLTTTAATLTIASLVGRTDAFLPPIPSSTSIRLHATPTSTSSSSPATAAPPKPAHGHGGGGHGGMMGGPIDPNSFVQTELRKEAMRLHTREQAPREGEAKEEGVEQSPFQQWAPTRQDYLQFLVDSKLVYETFDALLTAQPSLAPFRHTGLERAGPLEKDIAWFAATYAGEVHVPPVGPYGQAYAQFLKELAPKSLPALMCHYYNFFFAHTAGGRMIGKKMSSALLDGHELHFYQWEGSDVKEKLDAVRRSLDSMAAGWSREEKDECVGETKNTFTKGGSLLAYIARPPNQRPEVA